MTPAPRKAAAYLGALAGLSLVLAAFRGAGVMSFSDHR